MGYYMHILVIPSWYPEHNRDISGSFFREQALALKKHGHRVGVIYPQLRSFLAWKSAFTGKHGVEQQLDNDMPTLRFHSMAWFPLVPYGNTFLWLQLGLRLYAKYARQYGQPDLIHAHSILNAGSLAQRISWRYNIPFVITEHKSAYARDRLRKHQLLSARSIAKSASGRFAVSQPFCILLEKLFGPTVGTWEEMPNVVEQRFVDRTLTDTVRNPDTFVFLNVALLNEKGVHTLISAFSKAFGNDPSVVLNIGGDGIERPRLEALARHLGVSDRVRFLGALTREQVAEAMAQADAFVLSSRYETFGVVIIEALAMGTPVVATCCGGPESIVRQEDGLLVPPGDVGEFADAMRRLREGYGQYQAGEIRAACIARFSEQAVSARLSEAYTKVLREYSRAAH